MAMTDDRLAAIRKRLQAATSGPFEVWMQADQDYVVVKRCEEDALDPLWTFAGRADAEFVAHALDDITDLLAEVGRLRGALAAVEWIGDEDDKFCPWCDQYQAFGHAEDCPRQVVLRQVVLVRSH